MNTRTERLSTLHQKIRSENEAFVSKVANYSKVKLLKLRLAPFDKTGELEQEISQYLLKRNFEKPKVDQDDIKEILPREFIFDLKRLHNELFTFNEDEQRFSSTNELTSLFVSNLHEKKRAELSSNEDLLFKDLNILEQKYNAQNPFDYREKFNPSIVQKALHTHEIPFRQMNVEIEKSNRDKITNLRKSWKEAKTKDKHKIRFWHFIIPLVLLTTSIVLLIVFNVL